MDLEQNIPTSLAILSPAYIHATVRVYDATQPVANKPVHDWTAYTVTTLSRPGDSLKPPDR